MADVTSRESAVAHLQAMGLHACIHDGIMGPAVKIWIRTEEVSGIEVLCGMTYISDIAGRWHIFDASTPVPVPQESLAEAVRRVAHSLLGNEDGEDVSLQPRG